MAASRPTSSRWTRSARRELPLAAASSAMARTLRFTEDRAKPPVEMAQGTPREGLRRSRSSAGRSGAFGRVRAAFRGAEENNSCAAADGFEPGGSFAEHRRKKRPARHLPTPGRFRLAALRIGGLQRTLNQWRKRSDLSEVPGTVHNGTIRWRRGMDRRGAERSARAAFTVRRSCPAHKQATRASFGKRLAASSAFQAGTGRSWSAAGISGSAAALRSLRTVGGAERILLVRGSPFGRTSPRATALRGADRRPCVARGPPDPPSARRLKGWSAPRG